MEQRYPNMRNNVLAGKTENTDYTSNAKKTKKSTLVPAGTIELD